MNLWIDIKRDALVEVIKKVDLVSINDGEARLFADTPNLINAARAIQELGPKAVVIKRGEYGALFVFPKIKFFQLRLYLSKSLMIPLVLVIVLQVV